MHMRLLGTGPSGRGLADGEGRREVTSYRQMGASSATVGVCHAHLLRPPTRQKMAHTLHEGRGSDRSSRDPQGCAHSRPSTSICCIDGELWEFCETRYVSCSAHSWHATFHWKPGWIDGWTCGQTDGQTSRWVGKMRCGQALHLL